MAERNSAKNVEMYPLPSTARSEEWMNEFRRKPAHAVPNWQAPTSTGKPAGNRVAWWRVPGVKPGSGSPPKGGGNGLSCLAVRALRRMTGPMMVNFTINHLPTPCLFWQAPAGAQKTRRMAGLVFLLVFWRCLRVLAKGTAWADLLCKSSSSSSERQLGEK